MKKLTLSISYFLLMCFTLSAQSSELETSSNGFKLYLSYFSESYQVTGVTIDFDLVTYQTDFNKVIPSFGYTWKKNEKHWHEFEVSLFIDKNETLGTFQPAIGGAQTVTGETSLLSFFSTRYERQRILINKDKFQFNLGGSGQLYWLGNTLTPKTSASFPRSNQKYWMNLSLVPRVLIKGEKFALDINFPLAVVSTGVENSRIDNPVIPSEERSVSSFDWDLFGTKNMFQARVGVLWYL